MVAGRLFTTCMVVMFILTFPAKVQAATVPCIVDESGYYVAGNCVGQVDEDLQKTPHVVQAETKTVEQNLLLVYAEKFCNIMFSQGFCFSFALVGITCAVVGLIAVGGYKQYNVRN